MFYNRIIVYCFVVVADTVAIFIFSLLCDFMFFFYVYELRLSATMLLNEYDDDDAVESHQHCLLSSAIVRYQQRVD